ncbi:non-ribosomal peptide synthase domain TIGR01720/amino acid adenylation domain-containing protein [Amycolatopsis tolypomycina]|uniref:Non-ribosomal peptide synthase domain TIGR01720/amino acid adenylation domain-containing protein n=1 Tax=Amycolatopsis tolypomycina TaxID=208445 RepID=A0A1H4VXR1_9PSEU|nr:non-ribosomal peptide synthetase [Amycolatopsis tolypomycina]SEC85191.1 non-ribosomal peptide synthase domain TIGR01720/amino acid adenylation domain-containing protein [Amycolatopsis tolypomycina]
MTGGTDRGHPTTNTANTRLSAAKRELLARRRGSDRGGVPRRDPTAPVAATSPQRALWFLDRYLGPGANSAYNLHHALRLRGVLDPGVLAECVRQVVARHDALRTTFAFDSPGGTDLAGALVLRVAPPPAPGEFTLPVRDAVDGDPAATVLAEASVPFDLTAGPLFRPVLFRLGERDHVLLLAAHHAVFDGASIEVVRTELAGFYTAAVTGRASAVAALPIGFADWAAHTGSEEYRTAVAHRLDAAVARLAGAPALLALPTDRPRGPELSTEGDAVSVHLDAEAAAALSRRCREHGVTLFTAVLAAYQVLLSRWSGQDDVCVGIPVSGRTRAEVADLVGCFVTTGVVRTGVDSRSTFRELLGRVAEAVHEARADADVPFEQVVARLHVDRATGHNPVFQAFLDVIPPAAPAAGWPDGLVAHRFPLPVRQAKFDLSLAVTDEADGMTAELTYRTDLFGAATATALLDQLVVLLHRFAAFPDVPVGEVSALSEAARERWRADGSGEVVDLPDETLTRALADATAATPEAIAVRAGDEELTYAELDQRATALAHRLATAGTGRGDVVAVALPRSLDLAVGLGAVLRAGAAYLPLDLDHPAERLHLVLADARPVCVLTTSAFAGAFAGTDVRVIEVDGSPEAATRALPGPHPADVAYVIYTSGSTGRPKGVEVPHRGIVNRLRWMQHAYRLEPGERVLQKTPATFDVSVWELFWPLLAGATVVFAPPGAHRDPLALARLVVRERITTLHFVPSMLRAFLDEPETAGARTCLRRVICSGEELPAAAVARSAEVLPGVELHNLYGPTEASVDVTAWECGPDDAVLSPPIGRPVWNTGARVLDDRLAPVPVGVAGELYLSGVQLALGYRGRPGLTAERFLADPWGPPGSRMYRTGDLVRRRPDGALVFLGRVDHQVKLRGQRIELGEIEHVLLRDPAVAAAVAVVRRDRPDVAQLVAYVARARGGPEPDEPGLIARMRAVLPAVMVPESVVVLDSFPRTPSGKLDRAALPAPAASLSAAKRRLLAGRADRRTAGPAPDDARVAALCTLFARLLGLDAVGPDDDFFRLGGDSIGSIRLAGAARGAGIGFSERMVFEHRTPRGLAAAATAHAPETGRAGSADAGTGVIALTPIMRWWRDGGGPATGFYQSALLRLPSGAGESALVALLTALADRHAVLRARLTTAPDGSEVLTVPPLSEVDPAGWLTRVDADTCGDEQLAAHVAGRLDPVHRMVDAVWLDGGRGRAGRLLLAVHHLAVDGVSWRVLLDDIAVAWNDAVEGRPIRLPATGTSFRTWVNHLVREASDPARLAELDTWTRVLSAPEPELGRALDPVADTAGSAGELVCELPPEHTGPVLNVVPDRFRASVDHVLLCALALAVRDWRDQRGTPSPVLRVMVERHGRHDVDSRFDLSRTVGWFTVRHPAALDLTAARTTSSALRAVKEQLRVLPDDGLGYGLLRHLAAGTGQPLSAFTEPAVAFNYLGRFRLDGGRPDGAAVSLSALDGGVPGATPLTSALDVTALAVEGPDGLRLRTTLTWAPGVLDEPSVRAFADHWEAALTALAALADDPYAGGATAADLFLDIDQDELDALQLELESDWRE